MTIHALLVPTYRQMLEALSGQLNKAAAFAAVQGIGEADFIASRLAPDMFPLAAQVRFSCLQPALTLQAFSGIEPPVFIDDETTITALQDRIAKTVAYIASVPDAALAGAEDRAMPFTLPNGMVLDMTGSQFARDWALPQFYFHLITAYAIMRGQGVELGKPDYVPHVRPYIRPGTMPGA